MVHRTGPTLFQASALYSEHIDLVLYMWLIESLLTMIRLNQHHRDKKSANVTINGNFLGKVGKNDTQVDCKRVCGAAWELGKSDKEIE